MKLGFKFFVSNIPTLIGWNVLTLLVALGNNKSQLTAFTLFISIIEMTTVLIFSLGYQIKMTISYFIIRRDVTMVKKLIRWMFFTVQINVII